MKLLDQEKVKNLVRKYGLTTPKTFLIKNKTELKKIKKKYFPVVIKIDSPDIVHKTDAGMVIRAISNKQELLNAFNRLEANVKNRFPKAEITNYVIQEQIRGYETIIGMKRDPQFGPAIMFGVGGIFVEVLKDVSFRIAPINKKDAYEMIREIKGYKVLNGIRGNRPINFKALIDILIKISKISMENKNFKEIDLNPVFVNEKNAKVVDIRIMVDET
ncbi:acetate--CoA ligase family protein [Candidatus Woesearchaeota archaeon]|nr:acetate--CoA ligase family protein [Candidatus Woesearchaeota archaeon]